MFHIEYDGSVTECRAQRICEFGDFENHHYPNQRQALAVVEATEANRRIPKNLNTVENRSLLRKQKLLMKMWKPLPDNAEGYFHERSNEPLEWRDEMDPEATRWREAVLNEQLIQTSMKVVLHIRNPLRPYSVLAPYGTKFWHESLHWSPLAIMEQHRSGLQKYYRAASRNGMALPFTFALHRLRNDVHRNRHYGDESFVLFDDNASAYGLETFERLLGGKSFTPSPVDVIFLQECFASSHRPEIDYGLTELFSIVNRAI